MSNFEKELTKYINFDCAKIVTQYLLISENEIKNNRQRLIKHIHHTFQVIDLLHIYNKHQHDAYLYYQKQHPDKDRKFNFVENLSSVKQIIKCSKVNF